jgi:hypothetical protein
MTQSFRSADVPQGVAEMPVVRARRGASAVSVAELSERETLLSFMGLSPELRDRSGCGKISETLDPTVAFGEHPSKDG